jgi:hypothetical protein
VLDAARAQNLFSSRDVPPLVRELGSAHARPRRRTRHGYIGHL